MKTVLLNKKRIILGVGGGIAAYKSAELIRQLRTHGADVRVVMTKAGCEFITPLTLQALSNNPVHLHLLDPKAEAGMGHIELARWADLILIAPATADLIANITHGLSSNLLTTLITASKAPIAIAPAMNQAMWHNKTTQKNIKTLENLNVHILGPSSGEQACGDVGLGRMLEPDTIITELANCFKSSLLNGRKIIITAGATQESIDPVRFITNHSSGKMGFALAEVAAEFGADVTLITGPVHLDTPDRVQRINILTAFEMLEACQNQLPADIFISAAAVSDYRIKTPSKHKIKKQLKENETLSLHLIKNPDILSTISKSKNRPFCVGFAAETQNIIENAEKKLTSKKLDLVIANNVANKKIGFNSDLNAVSIISNNKQPIHLAQNSKKLIARQILTYISKSTKRS